MFFIGGLNCLVTAFVVRSIKIYILCSLVTGFAARAAVIRYYRSYLKLKVSYIVLRLFLFSQLNCLLTTFV